MANILSLMLGSNILLNKKVLKIDFFILKNNKEKQDCLACFDIWSEFFINLFVLQLKKSDCFS